MRLLILSDLHLDFGDFPVPTVDFDVLVAAGDVGLRLKGLEWVAATADGRPAIYVPGNHEYYGDAIPRLTEKLAAAGQSLGIHVLDRGSVQVGGLSFFGATLWTDFELFGDQFAAMAAASHAVVDYRRIRVSPAFRKLRPSDTASMHMRARRWLETAIRDGATRGSVIITHHAPSLRLVPPALLSDPVSASYASNLNDLVAQSSAALWIHGHTHYRVDYRLGDTRVLSNPRGYVDEPVAEFDANLVITLNAESTVERDTRT